MRAERKPKPMPGRTPRDAYITLSVRLFHGLAARTGSNDSKLRHSLEQAHVDMLPDVYLAYAWMNTLVVTALTFVFSLVFIGTNPFGWPALWVVALGLLAPLLIGMMTHIGQMIYPEYRAGERGRAIDRDLPYAVNYIAAMSSAGAVPSVVLRDLARQPVYGEVAREIAWLVRDLDLLGMDLLTSLNRSIARSPSQRYQEFMQGSKTSILSGGDLKAYFAAKAEQYMEENRRVQSQFIDTLGILAESYVTVVIAGPLFMLVLLSIMMLIGKTIETAVAFLFLLIFVMLPVSHVAFSWVVKNVSPGA